MNEAELLFSEVLNCDRAGLYLDKARKLSPRDAGFISSALKRRVSGEPLQYILGKGEFMGLEFKLTPDVLIPRQETELLVEKTIGLALGSRLEAQGGKILEIGTGSGCIAVALAKNLPDIKITATDISQKAIEVARSNAILHKVSEQINFIHSDLFSILSLEPRAFSLIVSNPPYIPSAEIEELQPEVRREPRMALDGGADGLEFYRRIIAKAHLYLDQGGFLVLEIGFGQRSDIEKIFKNTRLFSIIEIAKDYSGIDRVIAAKRE